MRSFRLGRARELCEDEILYLLSPTQEEVEGGCNWSVVTVGVEQPVNEGNPCVVDAVSD